MCQVQNEREVNVQLTSKLEDQIIITQKTEFVLEKLEELVSTKSLLIENLQSIIAREVDRPSCERTDLTSHSKGDKITSSSNTESDTLTSDEGPRPPTEENSSGASTFPGLAESVLKLKSIALHGVVLDGLLLWLDTQRRTVPESTWKQRTLTHFSKEEITNAKNVLWDISEESILGRNVARKGDSKSVSEIDDICGALKTLSEKQTLPTFIGTSTMVLQSPSNDTSQIKNHALELKLDSVEKAIDSHAKSQLEFSRKNHDKVVSKTDITHKKIEELRNRLLQLETKLPCQNAASDELTSTGIQNLGEIYQNREENLLALHSGHPWQLVGRRGNGERENTKTQNVPDNRLTNDVAERTIVVKGLEKSTSREELIQYLA